MRFSNLRFVIKFKNEKNGRLVKNKQTAEILNETLLTSQVKEQTENNFSPFFFTRRHKNGVRTITFRLS
mgnify:CR=1 FL=1